MDQQSLFGDTIFALSSGALPSGVAVIRLSGRHVRAVLGEMAGTVPAPRRAALRRIVDGEGRQLDRGLVLFFEGPASFTGEDCAELHVHGGRAVADAVLSALALKPGLRMAEAGEFTRRAFLNGRIDLTTAEAMADLVAAETEAQRRLALDNVEGGQRVLYAGWRERLVHARAMIEAELDFSDEADVPGSVAAKVWADMARLEREIASHLRSYRAAEIVREGFRVVLLGPPNAGKSSLLNALARRDVAIVTAVPGTTRDLVEVSLDLRGVKVLVTDTAGIRQSADIVERIGVERAMEAASRADLVLLLTDPLQGETAGPVPPRDIQALRVATKCDLHRPSDGFDHVVSALSGEGLPDLIDAMTGRAAEAAAHGQGTVPSRIRHKQLLQECRACLERALAGSDLELQAEEMRLASAALGRITGAVDVEDLLDVIFGEFCIGK